MSRSNLVNTVILVVILVVLVAGVIALISLVSQAARPLEQFDEMFQEGIEQITNPTPTIIPDPVTIIHEMQALSRLETASYTIEKVMTGESGQGMFAFLFGDRLIFVAHGQAIAGVDLARMGEGDITIDADGAVEVTLPPAEVLVYTLDNQQSYVFDRDTGLVGTNPALETEVRRAAEEEILNAALEDGILEMAQRNAEVVVLRLIMALGFTDVTFAETVVPSPTEGD